MPERPPEASDEQTTEELRLRQDQRKRSERDFIETSESPSEERQHARRADKAAYLERKLAEREDAERDDSD